MGELVDVDELLEAAFKKKDEKPSGKEKSETNGNEKIEKDSKKKRPAEEDDQNQKKKKRNSSRSPEKQEKEREPEKEKDTEKEKNREKDRDKDKEKDKEREKERHDPKDVRERDHRDKDYKDRDYRDRDYRDRDYRDYRDRDYRDRDYRDRDFRDDRYYYDRDRRERDHRDKDYKDRDYRDRDYRDRDYRDYRDRDYRDRDFRDDRYYYDRDRRERDRRYYRERDRERERERDRERDRDRDRDREKDKEKDKDRPERDEKNQKEREWERFRDRSREIEELTEKEEEERDSRTVFTTGLPTKIRERELYDFFTSAGKVKDIRLITDKYSRKSKGFGYVEYESRDSIEAALRLSGSQFHSHTVIVQLTQSEKNRIAAANAKNLQSAGPTRLYVGSLHFNVTEDDIRTVFSPFGEIDFVNLHMDPETGRSKGFGFVQFKKPEDAKRALQHTNGLELAGRQLKVGLVNEGKTDSGMLGELDDDEGGGLILNAQSRAMLMARLQRIPDGGGGNSSNSTSKASPTVNLSSSVPLPTIPALNSLSHLPLSNLLPHSLPLGAHGLSPVGLPLPHPPVGGPVPPFAATNPIAAVLAPLINSPPSGRCILLKNMFDPTTEDEPDFDKDIKEDVESECTSFGPVEDVYVEKDSQGYVYVKFRKQESAQAAITALNHRWFAGKMISAEFVTESHFDSLIQNRG